MTRACRPFIGSQRQLNVPVNGVNGNEPRPNKKLKRFGTRMVAVLVASLFALTGTVGLSEEPKKEREGGIIGTGIVGTVTELGSIIVNGQKVTFGEDTMAASVLGGQRASELTPGDTVVVVARPMPQDWRAATIERYFALVGPVDLRDGGLHVHGTLVDTTQAAQPLPDLKDGDWVAISGLWKETTVMASKLEPIMPRTAASISGSHLPRDDTEGFNIGLSRIDGLDLSHVRPGDTITVTGQPVSGGIVAETVRIGLFAEPMAVIIAQGYMSPPTSQGLYTILGSGAVSFTDQPQMIDTDTLGVYCVVNDPEHDGRAIMTSGAASCQ